MPPYPQRLPIVGDDDGVWGNILRQYLEKEHYQSAGDTDDPANGGHQFVTIRPGTTSKAPLTLSSGPLRTTPAIGSIEFYEDKLYFTKTTGPTRQTVATYDTAGAAGDLYYRDSNANFVRLPIGDTGDVLTVSSNLPSWQPTQATDTFSDADFTIQNASTPTKQLQFDLDAITPGQTRTLTVPDADMTLVGEDTAQTLTNKTIDGNDNNTLQNIPQSAITDLASDLAGKAADSAVVKLTGDQTITGTKKIQDAYIHLDNTSASAWTGVGVAAYSSSLSGRAGMRIVSGRDDGGKAWGYIESVDNTGAHDGWEAISMNLTDEMLFINGDTSLNNHRINLLANPVDGTDAANKNYVDTGLAGKANTSHDHSAANITSGTLDAARMPSGYRAIHVGTSPPDDTSAIWIDTSA